jgi:hypothetical protein
MRPQVDASLLRGRWLHAHEEDQPGQKVFRPPSHPLPPSRGRTGYEFHPDGRLTTLGSGPDDRSMAVEGSWSMDPQGRLTIQAPGGTPEVLDVLELGHDRLVVRA